VKKIWIALGVVVALVVVLAVLVITSLDRVVAMAIEHYGSVALGTALRVGSVSIEPARGKGTIEGLQVAQPAGYGPGDAIAVEEITLDLDEGSLASGSPYVISLVRVAEPRVAFVMHEDGSSNIKALQAHVARYGEAVEGAPDAPAPADEGAGVLLRVDRLEFEGGWIEADLTALRIGRAEVRLPPMHIDGLGGAAGAPPGDIAAAVGTRYLAHVLTTVAQSTIGRRLDQLLDEGSSGVRKLLDSLFPR
jgi:hypothetical protein